MESLKKTTIIFGILLCFLSINSFSQSQIYSTNYKGCIKEQFDYNFIDYLIYDNEEGLKFLKNITSVLTEEELKPIKEEYDILYGKMLYNITYLKTIPKSYPITDKTTKDLVCKLYFEMKDMNKRTDPIQNYCSRIYQDKELKNYAKERLSRQ